MNKMRRAKKLAVVTIAALAMVLVVNAPSQARGWGVTASGVGTMAVDVHHGFGGHHGFHGGFGFGPVYPYYGYYGYYPPALRLRGSRLLVLLPELRGVLPERGELPGGVGASPGVMSHDLETPRQVPDDREVDEQDARCGAAPGRRALSYSSRGMKEPVTMSPHHLPHRFRSTSPMPSVRNSAA